MKPRSGPKAEDRAMLAWRSLVRASLTALRTARGRFQAHGLSGAQFRLLWVVSDAGAAGVKLSDISRRMYVTSANVTGLVDRLEVSGHVTREADSDDRRVLLAKLTPKGQRVLGEVMPAHRAHVLRVMSCLSAKEQSELTELLSRVAERAASVAEHEGNDDR